MSNVLTDVRFLTPERLTELQGHGDVQVSILSILQDVNVRDPEQGEQVIGTLTQPEAELFRELYLANLAVEEQAREAVGRHLSRLGETIQHSDRRKPMSEVLQDMGSVVPGAEEGDAKRFHAAQQRANMFHACFYYHVGERLDAHDWRLAVRSKGRIVRKEMR